MGIGIGWEIRVIMNIYKKVQIFCYAVFLSLIINDNLYSSGVAPPGLRCEVNEWNEWNEDTKKNIEQTIGLQGAKYIFLVPEKVIYHDNSASRDNNAIIQDCRYENKIFSVRIAEFEGAAGIIYFYPHLIHADRDEYNNMRATYYEYRMYFHKDTPPLGPIFFATSSIPGSIIRPKFYYHTGTMGNHPYYFVLIIRKPNKPSEVYSMKMKPKHKVLILNGQLLLLD